MSDLQGPPDSQIRDDQYVVQSRSLLIAGAEPVPDEIVRDLLLQEWIATDVAPRPTIIVQDDKVQGNMKASDHVVVAVENYQEQPVGYRHEFADVEVPLTVHIYTVDSRTRLWSLMAECRRIFYRWMLALQPFHVIYFDGFQPDYTGVNNFQGIMRIRLTAGAVPIFLRHTSGEPAPNTDPELFPQGL